MTPGLCLCITSAYVGLTMTPVLPQALSIHPFFRLPFLANSLVFPWYFLEMENLTSQASFPTLGQITSQWSTNGLTAQASTCPSPLHCSLGMDMFMRDPIRQIMAAQSCLSSLRTDSGPARKFPQEQGPCWCYPLLCPQFFPQGLGQKRCSISVGEKKINIFK